MEERNREQTQQRILKVAAEEFAAMGFAGARVDVIAKKAKVNKALIYYYFKSKRNLLDTMFNQLLEKGIGVAAKMALLDGKDSLDTEDGRKLVALLFGFLEENEDIIRVILIEGMKKGGEDIMGKLMSLYMDSRVHDAVDDLKSKGVRVAEDQKLWMVMELFTGLLPVINYVLFRKNLSRVMDVELEELNQLFLTALEKTHLHTHVPES